MSLIQPFRCVRGVRNRGIENGHDPNFHLRTLFTHTHAHTSHTRIHYSKLFLLLLSPLSPFYSRIAGTIIPLFLAIKRQEDANSRRVHERLGYPEDSARSDLVSRTRDHLSLSIETRDWPLLWSLWFSTKGLVGLRPVMVPYCLSICLRYSPRGGYTVRSETSWISRWFFFPFFFLLLFFFFVFSIFFLLFLLK